MSKKLNIFCDHILSRELSGLFLGVVKTFDRRQTSIFGVVCFVSKSLFRIERQKKLEKFSIFNWKSSSHIRILTYRTWPIVSHALIVTVLKARNRLAKYFYSRLDGMLVHHRVIPSIKFPNTHLYIWAERGTLRVKCLSKNTTQCPRPGIKPGTLVPETSALTMRPPHLWRRQLMEFETVQCLRSPYKFAKSNLHPIKI